MLVAQITDTHITAPGTLFMGIVDTASALAQAVAALNLLDPCPDLVVLTGDLVESGKPEEYDHLCSLLAPLRMPLFAIPGNHDAREPMRQAFAGGGYLPREGYINYVIEDYPMRIIGLDTLVPGEGGGALCSDTLRWIDRVRATAPDRPSLVLMHHPPFVTGISRMGWPGQRRALRIRSSSISVRMHGSASRSSLPGTNFTTGAKTPGSSRTRRPLGIGRGHTFISFPSGGDYRPCGAGA
jgi:Icc protein